MTKSDMKSTIILTCEHASYDVPKVFKYLFASDPDVLKTHRGYDIGAHEVANYLANQLKCKLIVGTYSRLLVELNRSAHHQKLFSSFSSKLTQEKKNHLIETIYEPYRQQVVSDIHDLIKNNHRVYHLSIHSFTPILNSQVRNADIAFLYSTKRHLERDYAHALKRELTKIDNKLKVRMNYPYKGDSDGFTKALRLQFPQDQYLGVEIEMNQKYFISDKTTFDFKSYIAQALISYHSL